MTKHNQETSALSESMAQSTSTAQFVGFQLAQQDYAFPIQDIQEIVILDHVTCVPQVPDYVEGVSNLRGTIIPIINLRKLFGIDPQPASGETRTIVVNVGERTMGCTVDSVAQVIRIPAESIQPAPDVVASAGTAYVTGFAKLDERLVILLDVNELLDPEKLESVYRATQSESSAAAASPEKTTTP